MSYLPYVLAVVSVICLIIIIVLIVKSCSAGDDDTSDTKATGDVSITDISGLIPGSSDPTTESTTEPEVTEPDVDAPIGVYTFSDKSGCRTWWDLFYHVYGVKIDGEKDPYVTTILTYNDLDSSYKPKSGDQIKLPPLTMFPPKGG